MYVQSSNLDLDLDLDLDVDLDLDLEHFNLSLCPHSCFLHNLI